MYICKRGLMRVHVLKVRIGCAGVNETYSVIVYMCLKGPSACESVKSRYKGNDQEPIQSNSTSCPKHQMGKGHL